MENTEENLAPSTNLEREAPVRSTRLRVIGIFLGISALIIIGVLGTMYYAYTKYLDPTALKLQLEEKAANFIGMPVKVGNISLKWPTITVSDLKIGEQASAPLPFLEIKTAQATPDMFALLSGEVVLDNVYVSSITGRVSRKVDGRVALPTGLMQLTNASNGNEVKAGELKEFPLRQFDIEKMNIAFEDKISQKTFVAFIPYLSMKKALVGGDLPIEAEIIVENIGKLSIKGKAKPPENMEADITLGGVNTDELRKLLPQSVALPDLGIATLTTKLTFSAGKVLRLANLAFKSTEDIALNGAVETSSFSPLTASASFSIVPLPAKRLLELATPYLPALPDFQINAGKLGGQVGVVLENGMVTQLTSNIHPQELVIKHSSLSAPIEIAQGRVGYANGKVSWKDIKASMTGLECTSESGEYAFEGNQQGIGKLSIECDIVKTLANFKSFLPKQLANSKPEGKLSFQGTIEFFKNNFVVSGKLQGKKIQAIPAEGMAPVKFENIKLELENVNASKGIVKILECTGNALGMSVNLSGSLKNGADPILDIKASATADLAALKDALPIENDLFKKQARLSGRVNLTASISGSMKKPNPMGRLQIHNASFEIPSKNVSINAIDCIATLDPRFVNIESLKADFMGGKFAGSGKLEDYLNKPKVDAAGTAQRIDLAQVRNFIASNIKNFPTELKMTGKADLDLSVSGPTDNPVINGSAVIVGGGFTHPSILRPLTEIVGPVKFDSKGLKTEGLQMKWGTSTIRVAGNIEDWSGFKLAFKYDVQPLDLTDIGNYFLSGTGYKAEGSGSASGKVSGPIEKIVVEGTAQLPSGLFEAPVSKGGATFKFPFTNLSAPFRFTEGVLTVTSAKAKVFSGTLSASGKVFVMEQPIRFGFDTQAKALQTQEFLALNTSMKDVLRGGLDMSFTATGTTTGLDSLNGNSSVNMASGTYKAPPAVAQICDALGTQQLKSGSIKSINGKFQIEKGRIESNDLLFKTPYGQMAYLGSVGLDGTLNGTAVLTLPRNVCMSSKVLRDMVTSQSDLEIPVGVHGTMLSPSISLKLDALVKKAAANKAKEALTNLLGGNKLSGNESGNDASIASSTGTPEKAQDIPKDLKDLKNLKNLEKDLKSIFKRKR